VACTPLTGERIGGGAIVVMESDETSGPHGPNPPSRED
jgi:hypothetical protein